MNVTELRRALAWWAIHLGPRRDITLRTFNGLLTFPSKQWLPGKDLYIKRSHEAHEINKTIELLTEEGYLLGPVSERTVLNAGANIGMTSVALLTRGYVGRAIVFEPAPENYRLLIRNIDQNGLRNRIQAFQMALSSAEGELEMELSSDNPGDHRIRQIQSAGLFKEESRAIIKVPATTLDRLMRSDALKNERVDLVWVDIQGHEGHFFRGAYEFFKRGVAAVTEFWPYGIARSGISPDEFCGVISELFASYYIIESSQRKRLPVNQLRALFDVYREPRNFCLLVLLPKQVGGEARN